MIGKNNDKLWCIWFDWYNLAILYVTNVCRMKRNRQKEQTNLLKLYRRQWAKKRQQIVHYIKNIIEHPCKKNTQIWTAKVVKCKTKQITSMLLWIERDAFENQLFDWLWSTHIIVFAGIWIVDILLLNVYDDKLIDLIFIRRISIAWK